MHWFSINVASFSLALIPLELCCVLVYRGPSLSAAGYFKYFWMWAFHISITICAFLAFIPLLLQSRVLLALASAAQHCVLLISQLVIESKTEKKTRTYKRLVAIILFNKKQWIWHSPNIHCRFQFLLLMTMADSPPANVWWSLYSGPFHTSYVFLSLKNACRAFPIGFIGSCSH